jgi:hypothetical protein
MTANISFRCFALPEYSCRCDVFLTWHIVAIKSRGRYQQKRQCRCNVTLRSFRVNIVAADKQKTLYVWSVFVDLLIQHEKRMLRATLSSVTSLTPPGFSALSQKRHDFRKTSLNMKLFCWSSPEILTETFLFLRRTQQNIFIDVITFSCKTPVILARFQWNLNFFDRCI